MSVEPGFGGQKFRPEVLDKVRTVRDQIDAGRLRLFLEIDGGIAEDTIEQAAEAGVDVFVAGSAIYDRDDPAAAVDTLARAGPGRHDPVRASRRPAVSTVTTRTESAVRPPTPR